MNRKVRLLLLTLILSMCISFIPGTALAASPHAKTVSLTPANPAYYCGNFYPTMDLKVGPVRIGTVHLNVGMCWNGSKAWGNWGPDCYVSYVVPLWGSDNNWCGIWHNGWYEADAGMNFALWAYSAPWGKHNGY